MGRGTVVSRRRSVAAREIDFMDLASNFSSFPVEVLTRYEEELHRDPVFNFNLSGARFPELCAAKH